MDKRAGCITLVLLAAALCGCSDKENGAEKETEKTIAEETMPEDENDSANEAVAEEEAQPEILNFVDVFGEEYQVEINPDVEKHKYDLEKFVHEGERMTYMDDEYEYRLGVDVSRHQGWIDWEKVKAAGYEFAIIRVGYRGYGEEGLVCLDEQFDTNIQNAQAAGLDVGVYFFAQAINEEEAKEEAKFVLEHIAGYELQLPVVYDPESILGDEARTDDVSVNSLRKIPKCFVV